MQTVFKYNRYISFIIYDITRFVIERIKLARVALVIPEKRQPNPMKAMTHSVPRNAEKIRFPAIAAMFPIVTRMLVLVAL